MPVCGRRRRGRSLRSLERPARAWAERRGDQPDRGLTVLRGDREIDTGGGNQALVGTYWGTFRFELDAFPGSGFEETWQLQFNYPNQGEDEEVGTGYGVFEGWQIRTWFQILEQEGETDPYYLVWGYVFNPGC